MSYGYNVSLLSVLRQAMPNAVFLVERDYSLRSIVVQASYLDRHARIVIDEIELLKADPGKFFAYITGNLIRILRYDEQPAPPDMWALALKEYFKLQQRIPGQSFYLTEPAVDAVIEPPKKPGRYDLESTPPTHAPHPTRSLDL